jgi:hypothetical protein
MALMARSYTFDLSHIRHFRVLRGRGSRFQAVARLTHYVVLSDFRLSELSKQLCFGYLKPI